MNPKIIAFARHYGIAILPTRPASPREKGKIESGIKYVKNNALKGRVFSSLAELNRFLLYGETTIADTRIHGTTKKQVRSVFEEVERQALRSLPLDPFPLFEEVRRSVHRDGHVEVARSYYSVPPEYLGRTVWVRYDSRLVRIYNDRFEQIAAHARAAPGRFRTDRRHIADAKISAVERGADLFRHTAAVHLLEAEVEINVIRGWLGHVDLQTTNRYAELSLRAKENALRACEPTFSSSAALHHRRVWKDDVSLLAWLRSL